MRTKVAKGLAADERLRQGEEKMTWMKIASKIKNDKEWRQECLKRDEKFEMYFQAAVGGVLSLFYDLLS